MWRAAPPLLLLVNPLQRNAINLLRMKCVTHLVLPRDGKKYKLLQRTSKIKHPFLPAWHWHWNRIYWCSWTRAAGKKRNANFWSESILLFFYSIDFIGPSIQLQNEIEKFKLNLPAKFSFFIFCHCSCSLFPVYYSHPNFDNAWAVACLWEWICDWIIWFPCFAGVDLQSPLSSSSWWHVRTRDNNKMTTTGNIYLPFCCWSP